MAASHLPSHLLHSHNTLHRQRCQIGWEGNSSFVLPPIYISNSSLLWNCSPRRFNTCKLFKFISMKTTKIQTFKFEILWISQNIKDNYIGKLDSAQSFHIPNRHSVINLTYLWLMIPKWFVGDEIARTLPWIYRLFTWPLLFLTFSWSFCSSADSSCQDPYKELSTTSPQTSPNSVIYK